MMMMKVAAPAPPSLLLLFLRLPTTALAPSSSGFSSLSRLLCLKMALNALFLTCVAASVTYEASTATLDPELMMASYAKGIELNITTLHGGQEHERYSNDTDVGARSTRLTDEQVLMRKLFTGYDRRARPVLEATGKVTVGLGLTITQIYELDERNGFLITNVWLDQEWYDEYLRWDPKNYSGIEVMRIPSSKIWLPDILLYNNANDYPSRVIDGRAMVSSDGYVFWPVPAKLYSSCKVDVKYFPFDEQVCHMKFGSWTYDVLRVDLTNRTNEGTDLTNYVESGEWELISVKQRRNLVVYTCCEYPYPDVTFYVHIKRKTLYYFHNVFFPCFIMSVLTLLVFLLPPDSGEKCSLGITAMLAFAVFMLSVIEKLPETSESVPVMSIYLSSVMSVTAISVIFTVIGLNLHHQTSQCWRLASWILRAMDRFAPFCCLNTSKDDEAPKSIVASSHQYKASKRTVIFQDAPMIVSSTEAAGRLNFNQTQNTKPAPFEPEQILTNRKTKLSSQSSSASNRQVVCLTSGEFLQELESEMRTMGRGQFSLSHLRKNGALPPDQALALAIVRMIERHNASDKTDDIIRDWRRLAEFIDRILFWIFTITVVSFTFFILYLAPNERLL